MGVEQYSLVANDWLNLEYIINDLTQRVVGQELHPTSDPTFADLTLTGDLDITGDLGIGGTLTLDALTASRLVATDASKGLESVDLYEWVTQTANQVLITDDADGTVTFSLPQDIHTGATPTFAGATFGGLVSINKDSANAPLTLSCYHDTEATAALITLRKADGSAASPALVDDNAVLGTINFDGYDGSGWHTGVRLEAKIQGTPSDGVDLPTEFNLYTTPDGSATPLRRIVVAPTGAIGIGDHWSSNPTFVPTKTFEVVGTKDNDYIMNLTNLHATNGKGFSVRAGDDGDVLILSLQNYNAVEKVTVDGAGMVTIKGSPAIGLDMSGGTFATAIQKWPLGTIATEGRITLQDTRGTSQTTDLVVFGGTPSGDSSITTQNTTGAFCQQYGGSSYGSFQVGGAASTMRIQHLPTAVVAMFQGSTIGQKQGFRIYGYHSADVNRYVEFRVAGHFVDTLSIVNLSNYMFGGNVIARDFTHSDADGGRAVDYRFMGEKADGVATTQAMIEASHDDAGAGDNYFSKLVISTNADGGVDTLVDALIIDSAQNVIAEQGVFSMSETTTPTAIANNGAIYTKADNALYFQDGAGDEHMLHGSAFSNLWFHDPTPAVVTVGSADLFIKIDSFTIVGDQDDLGNVTGNTTNNEMTLGANATGEYRISFHGSMTGTGASREILVVPGIEFGTPLVIATATNATPIVITVSAGHGMFDGDMITVAGCTGNTGANGDWHVTASDSTTITLVDLNGDDGVGNGVYDADSGSITICYPGNMIAHQEVSQLTIAGVVGGGTRVLTATDKIAMYAANLDAASDINVFAISYDINRFDAH